jgi:hypothetical protein
VAFAGALWAAPALAGDAAAPALARDAAAAALARDAAAAALAGDAAGPWAASAPGEDAKVTVYPAQVWSDDPVAITVENADGCEPHGQVKLLFNGVEPLPGSQTLATYGFHFYGDHHVIVGVTRPINVPPAGHYDVAVICTDTAGKQTTYRSSFERLGPANVVRASILPFWFDAYHNHKIHADQYEGCTVTATVDGKPFPITLVDNALEAQLPALTPGIHLVALNCNGNRVTYPVAVDWVSTGAQGADRGGPGLRDDRGERAVSVFESVPTPATVDITVAQVITAVVLGAVVILLIGFPAEFVNKTIEANEVEINTWFARVKGPLRAAGAALKPWHWFAILCGLTAVLTTFVDPLAGLNSATLLTLLSFAIAVPLTTLVYSGTRELFTRRISGVPGIIHTIPRALLLAVVMTVASRIAGFQPGYVYGLVAGYIGLRERRLSASRDGGTVIAGSAALFAVSAVAWVALGSVHTQAGLAGAGFPLRLIDGILCATFLLGVQTLVFGLIPLRFLDGHVLREWNIRVWVMSYAPGIVLFILLLGLNSQTAAERGVAGGLISSLVLFVAFGVASMLFWAFFRLRRPAPAARAGQIR